MLKKVSVSDVKVGMYLHGLEGSWVSHPFWKSKFVISTEQDLQKLQNSGVKECWIDVSLGLDLEATAAPEAPPPAPVAAPPAEAPSARMPVPKVSMAEEVQRASSLVRESRREVQAMFSEVRLGKALDTEKCQALVNEVADSVYRNPGAIVSLARIKTADNYTYMHSVAVCALMVSLGKQLGLDETACREAGLAGMLHDMGKAFMPSAILNKPDKLTDEEFAVMKSHPVRGHEALSEGGMVCEAALDVCLHHHEKMDGSGYPHKLPGDKISLLARMGAVCDVYDAFTSNRPYKAGWDPGESVARMASWKGHFDTTVFQAFVKSLGIYPIGSLVRLESQRLAVVIEQNEWSLIAPVVKVFFSLKSQLHIPPIRLDLSQGSANDRIVGRESPEKYKFTHLDELWLGDAAVKKR